MVILYWLTGIILVALIAKIVGKSLSFIFKLIANSLGGLILLAIFNFFSGIFGISIALNFINCLIVGALGLPGIILLLIIQLL